MIAETQIEWFERVAMQGCPVFTNRQRAAAAYLEKRGKRFLKEYGFENCESMAKDLGWFAASHEDYIGWRRRLPLASRERRDE